MTFQWLVFLIVSSEGLYLKIKILFMNLIIHLNRVGNHLKFIFYLYILTHDGKLSWVGSRFFTFELLASSCDEIFENQVHWLILQLTLKSQVNRRFNQCRPIFVYFRDWLPVQMLLDRFRVVLILRRRRLNNYCVFSRFLSALAVSSFVLHFLRCNNFFD